MVNFPPVDVEQFAISTSEEEIDIVNASRTFDDWCLHLFVTIVYRKGDKWTSSKPIDI